METVLERKKERMDFAKHFIGHRDQVADLEGWQHQICNEGGEG